MIWIPLAAVPVAVTWLKAYKLGKQVDEEIAKMEESEAEFDSHRAEFDVVRATAREMSKSIAEVEQALKKTLRTAFVGVIEDVYRVASLAKALAELLDLKTLPDTNDEEDAGMAAPVLPN